MKNIIKNLIQDALTKMDVSNVEVEIIPAKGNGDFATNIAMKLSGILKDNPVAIANKIKENIAENEIIKTIEVAGPGFINFFVSSDQEKEIVEKIIKEGSNYGSNTFGKKINIEFVSANPTGYLHIGHARNAAIGDTLSRILTFAGNTINKEYWLNDSGSQINILTEAVFLRYKELFGNEITMPENTYKGEDIIDCAKHLKEHNFKDKYKDSSFDETKADFQKEATNYMLNEIKSDLKAINVEMDEYTSEKEVIGKGYVEKALDNLKEYIKVEEGSTWLKTTLKGDDKDRVLIKGDGAFTYFAPDIAGHEYKLSRGFDKIVDIFGKDHIGYGPRLKAAVELLGLDKNKFDILFMEMVSLVKDGKPLKMSKRAGTSFTIKDMLSVLTNDEIRYYLVSRSVNSHIELDVAKIKNNDSDNPLFNIQYSHARAFSLLAKSKNNDLAINDKFEGKEKELIMHLAKFPEIIKEINEDLKAHKLPNYLLTISRLFNSFYSNSKIIDSPREQTLLGLVKAVKIVIHNGLSLLGITSKDKL